MSDHNHVTGKLPWTVLVSGESGGCKANSKISPQAGYFDRPTRTIDQTDKLYWIVEFPFVFEPFNWQRIGFHLVEFRVYRRCRLFR